MARLRLATAVGQAGSKGGPEHALLGDDAGDELGRGDIERRVADLRVGRRDADAAEREHLVRLALLDRDGGAVGRREIHGAGRGADVERDAVTGREDGQGVGPDLVRRIAVRRDPVRPDEDDVHLAAGHQVARGHVGDERVRDAGLGQLPGGQPRALEIGPGLVDPDVDGPVGVVGRLDDPERGPELAAGQRPRIAVGQDPQRPIGPGGRRS